MDHWKEFTWLRIKKLNVIHIHYTNQLKLQVITVLKKY